MSWAPDGETFLFTSDARTSRCADLVEYHVASAKVDIVWRCTAGERFAIASPDHRRFGVVSTVEVEEGEEVANDVHLVERGKNGGRTRLLSGIAGAVHTAFTPLSFSPSGEQILFAASTGEEYEGFGTLDVTTHAESERSHSKGKNELALFDPSGRFLLRSTTPGRVPQVEVSHRASGRQVPLPLLPRGAAPDAAGIVDGDSTGNVLVAVSSDAQLAAWTVVDGAATDLFVADLGEKRARFVVAVLPQATRAPR